MICGLMAMKMFLCMMLLIVGVEVEAVDIDITNYGA